MCVLQDSLFLFRVPLSAAESTNTSTFDSVGGQTVQNRA